MMTKKDFKVFANAMSMIKNETEREEITSYLIPIFRGINFRFSEDRFREWIRRRIAEESTKGLR